MTRIAASHPTIWVDILTSNRDAVLGALDAYLVGLQEARTLVARGDRVRWPNCSNGRLAARTSLPVGAGVSGTLVELRVPVPERPGVIAEGPSLASRLGVNISAVDTADSVEGSGGVLVLVVSAAGVDEYEAGLRALGYRTTRTELG